MSGGRSELSEQEQSHKPAPPTEDVNDALDRLRSRIHEVAEWAQHASIPGGPASAPGPDRVEPEPYIAPAPSRGSESPVLSFLRDLADGGAIATGVYASDGQLVELGPSDLASDVPVSGMLALLALVPPETVLEVRTTLADWRAARVGAEAFALELRPGSDFEVDEWLSALLPPEKD